MHSVHLARTTRPGKVIARGPTGQTGMQESLKKTCFFLTVEIFRKKKGSFLWKCEDIPKNLGFSFVSELVVSAPIPHKTFQFTAVFHLSFKSLLNSCAK